MAFYLVAPTWSLVVLGWGSLSSVEPGFDCYDCAAICASRVEAGDVVKVLYWAGQLLQQRLPPLQLSVPGRPCLFSVKPDDLIWRLDSTRCSTSSQNRDMFSETGSHCEPWLTWNLQCRPRLFPNSQGLLSAGVEGRCHHAPAHHPTVLKIS